MFPLCCYHKDVQKRKCFKGLKIQRLLSFPIWIFKKLKLSKNKISDIGVEAIIIIVFLLNTKKVTMKPIYVTISTY